MRGRRAASHFDFGKFHRVVRTGASRFLQCALDSDSARHDVELFHGEWDRAAIFRYARGAEPKDFVWTLIPAVSGRVVELFRANAITGWATYPVTVVGRSGDSLAGFHGLAAVGRCGPLDESRSTVTMNTSDGLSWKHVRGYYFDPRRYDGSDIFSPEGTLLLFVSERVKKLLVTSKVANVEFKRITAVTYEEALPQTGAA